MPLLLNYYILYYYYYILLLILLFDSSNFQIRVLETINEYHTVYEILNVDVSFMNALRRILLSEIPTVALENIYMWHNNSIIHDEVLSHRLGLIPLMIDARLLDDPNYYQPNKQSNNNDPNDNQNNDDNNDLTPTDRNTVVFSLSVSCTKNDKGTNKSDNNDDDVDETTNLVKEEEKISIESSLNDEEIDEAIKAAVTNNNNNNNNNATASTTSSSNTGGISQHTSSYKYPKDRPYTKHVYSSDLIWVPQGEQLTIFGENAIEHIKPIHDDILIAKLRPGQSIDLEAHGQRGIGKDHAKYSPVCTAYYRFMPLIEIIQPIYDENAKELVYIYEPGVFDLIPTDHNNGDPAHTKVKAIVKNPYACTMSRNYMKNTVLKESIVMKRISNHYIFNIESVGQYKPHILLAEAIRVLQRKCTYLLDHIDEYQLMKDNM